MALDLPRPFRQLTGGAPDPVIVPLDEGTQGLLNRGTDRATRPSEDYAADLNRGVAEAAQQFSQGPQAGAQESKRLGMDDGFNAALRQAYGSRESDIVNRLVRSNQYRGQLQRSQEMHRMSIAAMAQQRVATQNFAMLTEAYNQQEMARAQFISQLFQTGANAMSMYAAQNRKANATDPNGMNGGGGSYIGSQTQASNPQQGRYGLGVTQSRPEQDYSLGGNYQF